MVERTDVIEGDAREVPPGVLIVERWLALVWRIAHLHQVDPLLCLDMAIEKFRQRLAFRKVTEGE